MATVDASHLERFDSVESFQTGISTETYETASSSLSGWDRKAGQVNKQSCLLSWVNSLDDGFKRTYAIHQISGENAAPIKDKSLFSCEEFCRICHCGAEDEELISPCRCSGSAKYAHQSCLLSWFEMKKDKICELCLYEINVKKTGFKPLAQWRFPWRSCDIVAYLFIFYCLVLIVFMAMVLWIASRRCLTPICVMLYFSCGLAVCYFTYCCGCIENIRYYWKSWIELNRQWLILTHKDPVQTPGIVMRTRDNESRKQSAEYV